MRNLSLLTAAIAVAALFFAGNARAQTAPVSPWRLDFGLESGAANGALSESWKFETGATARLQYSVSKNFALTLTSGYYSFSGGKYYNTSGMIPVKLGFKVFVGPGFYFNWEAGAGFETQNYYTYNVINYNPPKNTKLILSPGVGYAKKSWDFGLRWERFTSKAGDFSDNNYGMAAVRVAYSFGL